jgi:hypothetical protein
MMAAGTSIGLKHIGLTQSTRAFRSGNPQWRPRFGAIAWVHHGRTETPSVGIMALGLTEGYNLALAAPLTRTIAKHRLPRFSLSLRPASTPYRGHTAAP